MCRTGSSSLHPTCPRASNVCCLSIFSSLSILFLPLHPFSSLSILFLPRTSYCTMRSALALSSAVSTFASISSAVYTIQDDYSPSNFASMFDFFTDADPTSGFVDYVSQSNAESQGLYSTNGTSVYMGVDSTNVATGRGRDSVRISSKKSYNHGLIILDLAHMPGGQCGSWPAFWLLGPDWPNNGEVDIIEGVNSQSVNSFASHTNAGCSITSTGAFSATLGTSDCDVNAPGQGTNVGCTVQTRNTETYGTGFNAAGGGVYATDWTSEAISIWFFSRSAIPSDIASGNPHPDNWGLPIAQFTGGCDIDEHFKNQQIMFDITFCGQWAGQVWSQDAVCAPKAKTCQDYVQNNPTAFAETYWSINSLKVYQENGVSPSPSSSSSTSSASASSTVSAATSTTSQPTTLATVTSVSTTSSLPPVTTTTASTTSSSYSTSYSTSSYSPTTTYSSTWSTSYTNTWASTYTITWPSQSWTTQSYATSWLQSQPQPWTQTPVAPAASSSWTDWGTGAGGQGAGQGGGWGGRGGAGGRWVGPP
jgi:Glycosyl hydrolases family 16